MKEDINGIRYGIIDFNDIYQFHNLLLGLRGKLICDRAVSQLTIQKEIRLVESSNYQFVEHIHK